MITILPFFTNSLIYPSVYSFYFYGIVMNIILFINSACHNIITIDVITITFVIAIVLPSYLFSHMYNIPSTILKYHFR